MKDTKPNNRIDEVDLIWRLGKYAPGREGEKAWLPKVRLAQGRLTKYQLAWIAERESNPDMTFADWQRAAADDRARRARR